MREIKFRAWIKNADKMVDVIAIDLEKEDICWIFDDYVNWEQERVWIGFDDIALMQYTGLKDKNDVEIYEYSELDGAYEVIFKDLRYSLRHIRDNDIIDLHDYWRDKNGEIEVTREYTKVQKNKKGILTNSYSKQKSRHAVEYSLTELHDKFMSDDKFDRIYKEWKNKGYKKELKPTIDRINCRLGYTLSNIHALTWEENRYKQRMELKFLRARPIVAMVDGEEKYKFKSVSQAVKETGIHQGNISSCLTGKRKKAGGFNWFYENPELLEGGNMKYELDKIIVALLGEVRAFGDTDIDKELIEVECN